VSLCHDERDDAMRMPLNALDAVFFPGRTREEALRQVEGHPATADCPDMECLVCGIRDCPLQEPLHYHHDGCPAEYVAESKEA
jgi:hypothetical protein